MKNWFLAVLLTGMAFSVWAKDPAPDKTEKPADAAKTKPAQTAKTPKIAGPEIPVENPGSPRDLRAVRMRILVLLRPGNRQYPLPEQLAAFEKTCSGKLGTRCASVAAEIVQLGKVLGRGAKEPGPGELPEECYVDIGCRVCHNEGDIRCRDCFGRGFTYKRSSGEKPTRIDCKVCNKTGRVPCPEKCEKGKPAQKFSRGMTATAYEARLLLLNRLLLKGR